MVPLEAGVLVADHDPLAGEAEGPQLGRADDVHVPFDRLGVVAAGCGSRLRQQLPDSRVGLDARHVGPGGDRRDQRGIRLEDVEGVHDREGAVTDSGRVEPRPQALLAALGGRPQRVADRLAPGRELGRGSRGVELRALGQDDQDPGRPAVRGRGGDPWRDRVVAAGPGGLRKRRQGEREDGNDESRRAHSPTHADQDTLRRAGFDPPGSLFRLLTRYSMNGTIVVGSPVPLSTTEPYAQTMPPAVRTSMVA